MKLLETESVFAFMDIGPIARGHCLVIPKCKSTSLLIYPSGSRTDHAEKLTDLPDDQMADILPALKKLAKASVSCNACRPRNTADEQGSENYNILQVR